MPLVAFLLALTINTVSPQTISSADDIVTISASASGLTGSSPRYLQAVFTKEGESTNYLGFTRNLSDEWCQYKSSPTSSDLATFFSFTPVSGTWSGQLSARVDISDDGFKGPGNYILKLFRYISSSGTASDNTVPIAVNISLPTAATASTTSTTTAIVPEISWSVPGKVILGETFKLGVKLKNFEADESYYLKVRAGLKDDLLTKAQTLNEDTYVGDGAGWADFPGITVDGSGNWSGDVSAILPVGREEGKYRIKIRWRRQDAGGWGDSDIKEMQAVKPNNVVTQTVATSPAQMATPEAKKTVEATVSGRVLASATESNFPVEVKGVKATTKTDRMPVFLGLVGLLCLGISVWGIIRKRWQHR
jgi:hypothetical protein